MQVLSLHACLIYSLTSVELHTTIIIITPIYFILKILIIQERSTSLIIGKHAAHTIHSRPNNTLVLFQFLERSIEVAFSFAGFSDTILWWTAAAEFLW